MGTELTIHENTGFENWYLSRFLTFIVRDEIDKDLDTKESKTLHETVRIYNKTEPSQR